MNLILILRPAVKKKIYRKPNWTNSEIDFLLHSAFLNIDIRKRMANAKHKLDGDSVWQLVAQKLNSKGLTETGRTGNECHIKVKALRKEYNTVLSSTLKTGNSSTPVKKPQYWNELVDCMAENPGYSGQPLLTTDVSIEDSAKKKKNEYFTPEHTKKKNDFSSNRKSALNSMCMSIEKLTTSLLDQDDDKIVKCQQEVASLHLKVDQYHTDMRMMMHKMMEKFDKI